MSNVLVIFIVVVTLDIIGLLMSYLLYLAGAPTITDYARANWLFGLTIIFLQYVGVTALSLHFWDR